MNLAPSFKVSIYLKYSCSFVNILLYSPYNGCGTSPFFGGSLFYFAKKKSIFSSEYFPFFLEGLAETFLSVFESSLFYTIDEALPIEALPIDF
jgi:hypothetical protein